MHSNNYYNQNGMSKIDISFVPECLRQYLTTIDDPQDSHEYVTYERDQRIRLLLRRFTNQIQHGCKNVQCTVPTCLSYRKRHAKRPVRPYIDVAAQALAVQCVERCVNSGRLDEIFQKEKRRSPHVRRNSASASLRTGLCYSDPIVPWYSHPDDQARRASTKAQSRGASQNGTLVTPASLHKDPETNRRIHPHSNLQTQGDVGKSDPLLTATHARGPESTSVDSQGEGLQTPVQHAREVSRRVVCKASHIQSEHTPEPDLIKTQKRDHASFTQWLFDHEQFRAYEGLKPFNSSSSRLDWEQRPDPQVSNPLGTNKTAKVASPPASDISHNVNHPKKSLKVQSRSQITDQQFPRNITLSLLPASAVLWLRYLAIDLCPADAPKHLPQSYQRDDLDLQQSDIHRFVKQCIYFTFSDPKRLTLSASLWQDYSQIDSSKVTIQHVDGIARKEIHLFRGRKQGTLPTVKDFAQVCRDLMQLLMMTARSQRVGTDHVLASFAEPLLVSIGKCYRYPSFIEVESDRNAKYYSNPQVACLIFLVFSILTEVHAASSFEHEFRKPYYQLKYRRSPIKIDCPNWDLLPAEPQLSQGLASIASLISHRLGIDTLRRVPVRSVRQPSQEVDILSCIMSINSKPFASQTRGPYGCRVSDFLQAMKSVIVKEWDRHPLIKRVGPTYGALEYWAEMYKHRKHFGWQDGYFPWAMAFVADELNEIVDMPSVWHSFQPNLHQTHILEYPFLFSQSQILRYFRSINLAIMKRAHEKSMIFYAHTKAELVKCPWRVNGLAEILEKTRAHMARYFVMTVSRENVLEDAIGQIWRREHQELLRPLKVRIGQEEGEEGIDHGGVQQEFFRLVFAEAFDSKYGMFDVDSTTHMAWFKPGSLEPLYKFEALGVLLALAIFNGVTVPVTMPIAFYKKILGIESTDKDDIADGWPELSRGFQTMLDYTDGDVGDVIGRTYEFSYEAFGQVINIDMTRPKQNQKWPANDLSSSKGKERADLSDQTSIDSHFAGDTDEVSTDQDNGNAANNTERPDAPLVTNANRQRYVVDYIDHLLNITVKQQFEAFLRGMHTILSPRSLSLFSHSPASLKLVVEGHPLSQPLDVREWTKAITFDEYSWSDPVIVWFWEILSNDLDQTQLRKLLEFVTACNRIPVNGWDGVTFLIQRNGEGDARLPTSSTCYGRLLLPNYSSKEVLKEKLEKAIENSLGFGAL